MKEDCGTCREQDCPDHGQPHNMRTVTEGECAVRPDCSDCEHHEAFADEIDGAWYDDGCVCRAKDDAWHTRCCREYRDNPEDASQCPEFAGGTP